MTKTWTLSKILPWLLIICGVIGLLMSGIILYDKIKLLEDPSFNTGCNINPVIACGSVMQSDQATALWDIPNPMLGLAFFPVLITTGFVMLAGARLPRWYWLGLLAGTTIGLGSVHWLFFQSVYRIEALCPYCMGVWIVTIVSFWYVLQHNLREGYIKLSGAFRQIGNFVQRHHLDILILWFVAIIALILNHFWYYYGPLLGFD